MIIRTLAVCAAFLLAPVQGLAQEFDYKAVLAQSTSARVVFDEAFEEQNKMLLRLYFTMDVPLSEGNLLVQDAVHPDNAHHLMTVRFGTPAGKVAEDMTIYQNKITPSEGGSLAQALADVLSDDIFANLTKDMLDVKKISLKSVKIGEYDAVELVGTHRHPATGQVVIRIVGIFSPEGTNALTIISQVNTAELPITSIEDLSGDFCWLDDQFDPVSGNAG